ncbi:MAG: hypothetical protein Q9187_000022 [Circinaria calcarea]
MAEDNKWKLGEDDPGDEDEEELDESTYKSAKDAIIFAIEVSSSMLNPPPLSDSKKADTDTPASAALKCGYQLMQQRIISNPNDMMGVLLYGTEQTKFHEDEQSRGRLAYPNCYLLTDLDVPAADDVKALKSLVEDDEVFKQLMVPSTEPVTMATVLFCANQIFTTKAPNFASRRLFIVTDDDDPHAKSKKQKEANLAATTRAKDLYDLGVIIELFPVSKPGQEFDRNKFYNDIIYSASPTDPEAPAPTSSTTKVSSTGDGITLLNSLLSSINSKAVAKRALFSNLPFEIGPGFKISVKGYIVFKRQEPKRSCYVWLNGEKCQIAKGVTTQMADDTARLVEKGDIRKAYKFGGAQITFTPDEISKLRDFGEPGIRIIGFKPLSMLPIWANVRPATFIYPSEEDYIGSTRVFSALQQKLLKDDKMGLAWFIARKSATPVITAIIPGVEKLNDDGEQVLPPGMWIITLPFVDDIRQNPETTLIRSPDSLTNLTRVIIQQLQLPGARYYPGKYPNPALQWHYRILQALALEEDLPEKPEDKTVPRYRQINKRAGAYAIEWGVELEAQYQDWVQANQTSATSAKQAKRPASSAKDDSESKKKAKTAETDTISDEDMRDHFDRNSIAKLSMPVLKAWLGKKGLSLSGKKADLVERIEPYFEQK